MRFFKNILLALTSVTFLFSCNKEQSPRATFIVVNPVSAESVEASAVEPSLSLPRETSATVKACIQDEALLQPVISHAFVIDQDGTELERVTDSKGCLYWSEAVPFNYLSRESYFRFDRKITAKGVHKGSVTISFVVDPWKRSNDSLQDLRTQSSAKSTSAALVSQALSAKGESQLFLPKIDVRLWNLQHSEAGSEISAQISLQPYLSRIGLDGGEVREPLRSGFFGIELALIEKSREGKPDQVLSKAMASGRALDGNLIYQTSFKLCRPYSRNSSFEIQFRLNTMGPGLALMHQGRVGFGQLAMDSSISVPVLALEDSRLLDGELTPSSCGNFGFEFDSVKVENGGVQGVSSGEHVANRISLKISACLKDSVDLKSVGEHLFQVQLSGSEQGSPKLARAITSDKGCLNWNQTLSFDPFSQHPRLTRYLIVRSDEPPFKNMSRVLKIYLSPRDTGSLFSWDGRDGTPPDVRKAAAKPSIKPVAPATPLVIKSVSHSVLPQTFELDSSLRLVVNKRYQLRFAPKYQLRGSLSEGVSYEPVKNGKFKLKVLLATDVAADNEKPEPLSFYITDVESVDGQVTAAITLPLDFVEAPLLGARGRLFLELSSLDPSSSLKPASVSLPFVPSTATDALDTDVDQFPSSAEITQAISSGKAYSFRQKVSDTNEQTLEKLAKIGGTKLKVVLGKPHDFGLPETYVRASKDGVAAMAGPLCSIAFQKLDHARLEQCLAKPSEFLSFLRTRQVESIVGVPKKRGAKIYLNVAAYFTEDKGSSVTDAKSDQWMQALYVTPYSSIGFGPLLGGFLGKLELGYRFQRSWVTSHTIDESEARHRTMYLQSIRPLKAEVVSMQFKAKAKRCLFVGANPLVQDAAARSLYICSESLRTEELSENWYNIAQQDFGENSLYDPQAKEDQLWTKVFRGDRRFKEFKDTVETRGKVLVLHPDHEFLNTPGAFGDAFSGGSQLAPVQADGALPGAIELAD